MSRRPTAPRHAIDISEENGVRCLHFGSDWVQGAMRVARPWSLELEYTRDMMTGLLLDPPTSQPRRILQIGLGCGSLTKFCYRHLPAAQITVVEINPQVEFVARQYFKLPDDPARLKIVDGCGADFILGGDSHFDWIMVDGYDPDARTGPLDTLPFFQACRARLSEDGLFVANFLGRSKGFRESVARLGEAFDQRTLALPACESGNVVLLASHGQAVAVDANTLAERADSVRATTQLNAHPLLKRLKLAAQHNGALQF